MTIVNGYATLAEFKAYAKITSTDTGDDSVIEDIIEGISRQIDTYCGRVFFVTTATARYFRADEGGLLFIDDVASTTGFAIATDDDGDGVYENTWAATDYNLLPYQSNNSEPFTMVETSAQSDYAFSTNKKGNKITALWGYAAIPDNVKQAALIAAEAEYHSRFGENMSGVATITGAGVVITPKGIPQSALQKLEAYRRLV